MSARKGQIAWLYTGGESGRIGLWLDYAKRGKAQRNIGKPMSVYLYWFLWWDFYYGLEKLAGITL